MNADNPLLDFSDLPRFDLVQPEQVKPAIESLLSAGRELIERLTAETTPATWRDFAGALADGLEPFGRAWGIVGHLHSVNDVPAWREAEEDARRVLAAPLYPPEWFRGDARGYAQALVDVDVAVREAHGAARRRPGL